MYKLIIQFLQQKWDDRLAEVAEKWAKECTNQHDKVRTIPCKYLYIDDMRKKYPKFRFTFYQVKK